MALVVLMIIMAMSFTFGGSVASAAQSCGSGRGEREKGKAVQKNWAGRRRGLSAALGVVQAVQGRMMRD